MDEKFVEIAEAVQEAAIRAGIERAAQMPARPVNFHGECECGEIVPEGRVALGYFNCVACQSKLERRR